MTTPEFGNSGITDSPLTGVTVNPWDTSRTTGGSSGGSVAAVAAGLGPLSIGTDTGGSIRTPSSFCGLVGLKPTFGRVAQYPETDWGGISVSGPIARTASDAALLMTVIAQPDPARRQVAPPRRPGLRGRERRRDRRLAGRLQPRSGLHARGRRDRRHGRRRPPGASRRSAPASRRSRRPSTIPFTSSTRSGRRSSRSRLRARFSERSACRPGRRDARGARRSEGHRPGETSSRPSGSAIFSPTACASFTRPMTCCLTPTAIVSPFETVHDFPPEWDRERAWVWELPTFPFNFSRQPALDRAVRIHRSGIAGRAADRGPDLRGCARTLRAARAYQEAYPTTDRRPPLD